METTYYRVHDTWETEEIDHPGKFLPRPWTREWEEWREAEKRRLAERGYRPPRRRSVQIPDGWLLKMEREPGVELWFKKLSAGTEGKWVDGTEEGWQYIILHEDTEWVELTEEEAAKRAAELGGSLADDTGDLVDRTLYKSPERQEEAYLSLVERWSKVPVPSGAETITEALLGENAPRRA